MNTNIINTNNIIQLKDELIKQLNEKKDISAANNQNNGNNTDKNNNNEIILLKMENENLKKQIEEFQKNILPKNNINNNLIKMDNIKDIQELNIQLKEENNAIQIQNSDLLKKIKELTLQDKQIQNSFTSQKDIISRLESDLSKKNEELEGLKTFIFKLQSQLESKAEEKEKEMASSFSIKKKSGNLDKCFEGGEKDKGTEKMKDILNKLNDAEKQISILQNKNRDLQFQLDEKQIKQELQGFRTEDNNISNYEEEFDLKKMVNGARDKNRSEDINIDYPGVQGIKDKYKELIQNMNMLEEQVKILICNISINNKVRPQIRQICQLMRISAKNIELIMAGKDKKKALGLLD